MAVDEQLLRSWIREAQARMALQPLTKAQLAVVAEVEINRKATAEAKGPDRSPVLLQVIKQVSGLIQEALRAHGVPAGVQDTLRQALAVLEGESPEGSEPEDQVAELAKKMSPATLDPATSDRYIIEAIHRVQTKHIMAEADEAAQGKEEDNPEQEGLRKLTREARKAKLP